jgi:hypothetical protein
MRDLPNSEQNNEQILNDIQSLQQLEQQLFNNLESNPNLTTEQQQKMVEKMNRLSNMRINLYTTMSGVNDYFHGALNSSIGSLKEQVMAIQVVETELNKAKETLRLMEEEKNNKIRLVEINNYFGDKYAEHAQLMKVLIFTLIPVIIIVIIHKTGFLPNIVYYILIGIISIIGGYYFWTRFSSIIMRDNMNYQEYDWAFDPNNVSVSKASHVTDDPWKTNKDLGTCVGDACCATGLQYDTNLNQCVTKETMSISDILSKKQIGKYKSDYNMGHLMSGNYFN